ncbi:MAG: transporter [Muribaculaceae bacterium]|nr:transporter [Muribaculaceae bacterium]
MIAQGAFICFFCPTATAAPVVTGMLGGSVELLATYSIISNIAVAFLAPILFAVIGDTSGITFSQSVILIASRVFPLILAPLALALIMKVFSPRVHDAIAKHQSLSFYIWSFALIIVVGNAVSFVMTEPAGKIPIMIAIAGVSLATCCMQFTIGRLIGKKMGDKISGAQGLGQKNTVLAIWMALTYLNPLASVAPAAYVAWQNIINSAQLYLKTSREIKK